MKQWLATAGSRSVWNCKLYKYPPNPLVLIITVTHDKCLLWHSGRISSCNRYCVCFNAARVCHSACRCVACSNTEDNEDLRTEAVRVILDRNPAAFDPKFLAVSFICRVFSQYTSINRLHLHGTWFVYLISLTDFARTLLLCYHRTQKARIL